MSRFSLLPAWRALARDRSGASAVEFALIAPVLIALYFGMAEYTQAMMADRKVTHVASSIGDLVSRSEQVSEADVTDIFGIGKNLLAPFSPTTLNMRVTSVTVENNVGKVDWSMGQGLAAKTKGSTVTLPDGVITNNETVIMAEAEYTYDSPVQYFIKSGLTFRETFYLRPRQSDKVLCPDC